MNRGVILNTALESQFMAVLRIISHNLGGFLCLIGLPNELGKSLY